MLGKFILWLSAVMFIAYGLVCLVSPGVPTTYAGLAMTNGDAFAEIGAMYGGLQTGFGLFCLLAAINQAYFRAGLVLLVLCVGSLALARLYSTLTGDEAAAGYTYGATAYEFFTAVVAAAALIGDRKKHMRSPA